MPSPSPSENTPWPAQTQIPDPLSHSSHSSPYKRSLKRRKARDVAPPQRLSPRQTITDWPEVVQAQAQCQDIGNDVESCFPTTGIVVAQGEWAAFVWNSRLPQFAQTNLVNIYLFQLDSGREVLSAKNQVNPRNRSGLYNARVDDRWWGKQGSDWNGSNITYPYYWVVTRNDKELDGSEDRQAVFHAVQTTYANSVAASMSSTSAAAATATSSTSTTSVNLTPTSAAVQPDGSSSGFPHWAIAVIVVLGFLAIATSCILAFFIVRRVRRRRNDSLNNRNSMNSASPMMAHTGHSPGSPLLAGIGINHGATDRQSSIGHRNVPSVVSPDGASTISRSGSVGDGPFSGADAAIMADAFRQALRKPDFASRPVEEGESPETDAEKVAKAELLSKELAEEGRDIRSVSSSRGVRVESVGSVESGDTIHDYPH